MSPVSHVLLLLLSLTACDAPPGQGPHAQVPQRRSDFGSVVQCEPVAQRFAVHNTGGSLLKLDVGPVSRDVATALSTAQVAPGAAASLEIKLDTCALAGDVQRAVVVFTNDPQQRSLSFEMRGSVDADLAVDPARLYLGHLRRGQDAVLDARLIVRPGLKAAVNGGRIVEPQIRPPARGANHQRLHLRIRRDAPAGRFDDVVRLTADNPKVRALEVPVSGFVDID